MKSRNNPKEKDIKICKECGDNKDGYCKKINKWCNFAREMCDKIPKDDKNKKSKT